MQQEHRLALAVDLVVVADAVGLDVAAAGGCGTGGGRGGFLYSVACLERLWAGWRTEYVSSAGDVGPSDEECVFCRILKSGEPDDVTKVVWRGHGVVALLNGFMTSDLSAFYFDIRKDSLYCDRPDADRRRAARTVMDEVFLRLTAWLAPIHCFTAGNELSFYPNQ